MAVDQGRGLDAALRALSEQLPGTTVEPETALPSLTPLLTLFAPSSAGPALVGETGEGAALSLIVVGDLAVAVGWLPATADLLPRVLCDERSGQLARTYVARADDAEENQTTPLESAAFSARYKLRVHRGADPIALRTLFTPTLIETLTRSPSGFGFELEAGLLVVYRSGVGADVAALRGVWTAAVDLIGRLAQAVPLLSGAAAQADDPAIDEAAAAHLRLVTFDHPPTAAEAVKAFYRHRFRLGGRPLRYSVKVTILLFILFCIFGALPAWLIGLATPGPNIAGYAALVVVAALALYIGRLVFSRDSTSAAIQLGEVAFFNEYARSRGLGLQSPAAFANEHRAESVGGRVQMAAQGRLTGGVDGVLAFCADGQELDTAHEYEAVVVELGRDGATAAGVAAPDGGSIGIHGSQLVVTSRRRDPLRRTPSDIDAFCDAAARITAQVRDRA